MSAPVSVQPDPGNDPNTIHRLPTEWRGRVELAARTVAPLFSLYGWTYHDGPPDEARLVNGLAHCLETVLGGSIGCSTGRWSVQRMQGEEGMDDEVRIYLDLGRGEVAPLAWAAPSLYRQLSAAVALIGELLKTDGWRNCASGSEKRGRYISVRREAKAFHAEQSAALHSQAEDGTNG